MSQGTVYVDCPCCATRLEVQRLDGKVVQSWSKTKEKKEEGGDLLKAAAERLKAEKEKRDKYMAGAKDMLEEQKRRLEDKFRQEKERIEREGDTARPPSPFDLD